MHDLTDDLNNLVSNLSSEYKRLCLSESGETLKECFEIKFKTSMGSQLSAVSHGFRDLIEFLTIAQIIDELERATNEMNKYHIAYSIQTLFGYMDRSFTLPESDRYVNAKKKVQQLKHKLRQYGIPNEWLNKRFALPPSHTEDQHIPQVAENLYSRTKRAPYSQQLNRLFKQSHSDFDAMMEIYKTVTPQRDWKLYDNIKVLFFALHANGLTKTTGQLYAYFDKA